MVVRGNARKKDPNVIYDPVTGKDVFDPPLVKSIIHREASKILANVHDMPPEMPAGLIDLYKINAINKDSSIWFPLSQQFTTNDILEYVNGPSKTPGFDSISKEH